MYLKRLEISGFKSFARPTALQFPSRVTAIVGPNGSGKSNCAEAMRWVLGEQSMKTLRSKKGEDLIFAGSATEPRMSKAQVVLVFDNSRKHFDVEFDEAAIGRRVFRDGENEYLLNGSPTRLKDTAELLAGVGIGPSQHNIISQGESDRILYVSSAERKEMIEEALGLKVYHLKYEEAERKLEKSEENIKQAEGLRKEIQPHVKFLKNQVEKFERATSIRRELEEKFCAYFEKESAYLRNEEMTTKERKINPQEKLRAVERKQSELKAALNKESSKKNKLSLDELENARKELVILRDKRSRLEREMGKIEGIIEAEKLRGISDEEEVVSREDVEQ
ncbi:MAG: AAA family ATPase, partial [Patescibacteria group bacterium]